MIKKRVWRPLGKKTNWVKRGGGGGFTYELIIWDAGRKIDRFLFNTKEAYRKIIEIIRLKYGLDYR